MNLIKKIFIISLVFVFGFVTAGIASAETVEMTETECDNNDYHWYEDVCYTTEKEKLQAQVSALTERVDKLLAQLQEQEEQEEQETEETTDNECVGVNFDRALSMGMEGEDVKCLQAMLNRDLEKPIAKSGPGSPGNETSYFGSKTKAGVARFQEKYQARVLAPVGLSEGTGYFGQQTRKRARERLGKLGWEREQEQKRDRDQEEEQDQEEEDQEEQEEKEDQEEDEEQEEEQSEELTYCETDEDCVVVKDNCCPPNAGGEVRCINEEYEESWISELNCDEEDQVCLQVDNRPLPDDCECVDNACQTTE